MRFLTALGLLCALPLTSCSSNEASAEEVAEQVADGFTAGELPPAAFEGDPPQPAYDQIVTGLGEVTPTVEVGEVTEDGAAAEATLSWSWALGEQTWEYEATLELTDDGEAWHAVWAPSAVEPSLADGESLALTRLIPERGDILGARGARLVTERPVLRLGIDKTQVSQKRAPLSAARAAELLDVEPGPFVRAVRGAGDQAFVEAIVMRPGDAERIPAAYYDTPGAVAIEDELPLAANRTFAAPVLGRVGAATAELIEESDGRVRIGDVVGLSGLQARYDEQLTGTPGLEVQAVGEDGEPRSLFTAEPVAGVPLRTTLDERLQTKAEQALAVIQDVPAALVAIRPSTGAVLAAANGPGTGGLNIATYGQYAPGSTFKIVSSLALLRAGVTADDTVQCPPSTVVDGKQFKNYDDYPSSELGAITLREALAHSCNTAFINARTKVAETDLAGAAESLGLGVDHDLGFPAYFGQVPPPESETELAADMIGQGKILGSPMVLATVAASVQAGRTVVPYLLQDHRPEASPEQPLQPEEAETLAELMRGVVADGSGDFLADLRGDVGAKTGTAEYGEPGPDGSLATHTWMIAFHDDLAVAVFVETGESGSSTAGPLLEAFLS
jgi:cell division protein FtsI/penicillin-binding protein 2